METFCAFLLATQTLHWHEMALVLKDRVKETTTTTGTGTVTLAGAVSGFQSFSVIGNANTTYYAIIGDTEWEIGIGTYTSSGTTLSRDTVLASSNSGSLVSFSAGTKTVFCDYPATKSVSTDSLATPPAIGATTPSTGKFTTLESTGTASLATGSTTSIQIVGDASYPQVKAVGGTNTPLVLQPLGTGALQAQKTDSTATGGNARGANAVDWQTSRGTAAQVASGQLSFIGGGINNRASAYASVATAGYQNIASNTGSAVTGGSTNTASGNYSSIIGGELNTAAGYFNVIGAGFTNSATSASAVTTQSGTMNATTAVTLSGSNASIKVGQYIAGTSIASETYVAAISGTSLTLSQAASGSSTSTLSFYTPHGVVVGGGNNQATGSYSFIGGGGDAGTAANRNVASGDWSVVAGGQKGVASGLQSTVGGGFNSTASGQNSTVAGGYGNSASNTYSTVGGGVANLANSAASTVAGGFYGTTRGINGYTAFPSCYIPVANALGVSQAGLLILGAETTNATATVLRSDTGAAGGTNQVILPNNSAYYFRGEVVAGKTGAGDTKGWYVEGVIKRGANAASTAIVGTATVTSSYADAGAATWALTATADTTNGGLAITFTGQASTTIRVVAQIRTTEMTY